MITPSISLKMTGSNPNQGFLSDKKQNNHEHKNFIENLNIFWGVEDNIDIDDIIGREKEHSSKMPKDDFFSDVN